MRSLTSHPRRTVKPLVLSALQPLLAIAVFSGLLCTAASAATRTASLLVSTTVATGCQVSPVLSAAQRAASAPNGWGTAVSVSCSLPVSYQVDVSNGSLIELAGLGPSSPTVTGLSGYGGARNPDSLRRPDEPTQASAQADDHGLAGLLSPDATQGSAGVADRSGDGPGPGTVTVTIVY